MNANIQHNTTKRPTQSLRDMLDGIQAPKASTTCRLIRLVLDHTDRTIPPELTLKLLQGTSEPKRLAQIVLSNIDRFPDTLPSEVLVKGMRARDECIWDGEFLGNLYRCIPPDPHPAGIIKEENQDPNELEITITDLNVDAFNAIFNAGCYWWIMDHLKCFAPGVVNEVALVDAILQFEESPIGSNRIKDVFSAEKCQEDIEALAHYFPNLLTIDHRVLVERILRSNLCSNEAEVALRLNGFGKQVADFHDGITASSS